MNFPREAVAACEGLYARNVELAHSADDNDRRKLTRMIVEQLAFALGDRWGAKKRHGLGDEYQSKDAIAYRDDAQSLTVWDWQNGTTRKCGVAAGAEGERLDSGEADFMPVTPVNHLGWGTETETTTQTPTGAQTPLMPPQPADLTPVLAAITEAVSTITTMIKSVEDGNERRYRDLLTRFEQWQGLNGPS